VRVSDSLDQRITSIEQGLRQIATDHSTLRGDHAALRGELSALRQLLEDSRAAFAQTRDSLSQLIVLQEKLLQQNEAQGRAFKQIGDLSGRVTALETAQRVLEAHSLPARMGAAEQQIQQLNGLGRTASTLGNTGLQVAARVASAGVIAAIASLITLWITRGP
jgi:chromosome segregation ATPase